MTRDEVYLGGAVVREFPYRPKWGMIIFGVVFFGACSVALGMKAADNDRGVVINGLIEFGPQGATAVLLDFGGCERPLHRPFFAVRLGPAVVSVTACRYGRRGMSPDGHFCNGTTLPPFRESRHFPSNRSTDSSSCTSPMSGASVRSWRVCSPPKMIWTHIRLIQQRTQFTEVT